MAVVRKAEAVQVWDANIGAPILHPHVRSHLRAQLFIYCARVLCFGKLLWHGTTKHKLLVEAGRSYLDRYTYIKAASNPLFLCCDNTGVLSAEPQVVLNKNLNSLSLVPEHLIELLRGLKVGSLVDDIYIFFNCRLVCDGLPVV
jgi:hypothetical protein